jgi:hypothetical protein
MLISLSPLRRGPRSDPQTQRYSADTTRKGEGRGAGIVECEAAGGGLASFWRQIS